VVILPSDPPSRCATSYQSGGSGGRDIRDCVGNGSLLRGVIDDYLKRSRINIRPAHEADHVTITNCLAHADPPD